MSVEIWQLFIDESGNFGDPDDRVVVAGLLMRAYDSPQLRHRLERALRDAVPASNYPPHANRLNVLAFHALACMLDDTVCDVEYRALCAPAVELLREQRARDVEAYANSRGDAAYNVLLRLETWLGGFPDARRGLLEARRYVYENMHSLLASLCNSTLEGGRAYAMAAWDAGGGPANPNRYLELLTCALERVVQIRGSAGEPGQRIWLHVATRDQDGGKLSSAHVIACGRTAVDLPLVGSRDQFEWIAHEPAFYGSRVHPGIVLADYIANRMRRTLRVHSPWQQVVDDADASFAVSVEASARAFTREGPLPTVAASGLPRRMIVDALRGQPPAIEGAGNQGWPGEQARAWVAAIARAVVPGGKQ